VAKARQVGPHKRLNPQACRARRRIAPGAADPTALWFNSPSC
jgi:hypothetical protein